jgi:Flp pilus assembly protein TadD
MTLALCGLLLVAVIAVFGQSAQFEFLNYDDGAYVSENTAVSRGISWKAVAWSFTSFDGANWHPVTWFSHILDCQLFGLRAGWHHAVNVLFHIANSILLYLLLVRMTAATWRSAMVAALFALHPLHVESVAWVAERKDVLCTLFALLTMLAYVRYAARPSLARYVPVIVLFALGLMSKPILVTLPFVLLLLDYWPLGRWQDGRVGRAQRAPPLPVNSWWGSFHSTHPTLRSAGRTAFWLLIEKVPLLLLAAASSVVTCIAQQSKGAMAMLSDEMSFPARLFNALVSYVAYLGKTIWPFDLIIFYPYPAQRPLWQPALAALFLIAVTSFAVWTCRRRPYLAVGWFWYLGTLLPVIGLVQVGAQSMADRYTYIPLIGIFILGVWGIGDLTAGWRYQRGTLAASAAVVILACSVLSAQQTAHWADSGSLFRYVLTISPDNAVAHSGLGDDLLRQNYNVEAEAHYRELARIEPKARAYAHLMWGQTLVNRDRPADAAPHFREAIRLDPGMAIARNNLAMSLMRVGKPAEVIEQLHEAVRLAPDKPEVLNNLAYALTRCPDRKLRNSSKAVEFARRAVELSDRQEPGYLGTLAAAYAEAGQFSEALRIADEAIALAARQKKPAPPDALRVRMEQERRAPFR